MANKQPRAFYEPNEPFEQEPPPQHESSQPKPLLFNPIYKEIHGPLYGEPNFQHHEQPPHQETQPPSQSQSQHFESFFPSYEEIEASLWNNPPNTHEELNDCLENLYAFKNMVDTHLHQALEIQNALLSSVVTPNTNQLTTNIPPPPPSTNNPIYLIVAIIDLNVRGQPRLVRA